MEEHVPTQSDMHNILFFSAKIKIQVHHVILFFVQFLFFFHFITVQFQFKSERKARVFVFDLLLWLTKQLQLPFAPFAGRRHLRPVAAPSSGSSALTCFIWVSKKLTRELIYYYYAAYCDINFQILNFVLKFCSTCFKFLVGCFESMTVFAGMQNRQLHAYFSYSCKLKM